MTVKHVYINPIADDPAFTGVNLQGKQCGSKNEYNFGKALEKLGISYEFQVSFGGGRGVRGGQVIDFLVNIPPKPIPVYIQGAYWHKASTAVEDLLKQASVQKYYAMPILVSEDDSKTLEAATRFIRENVM